MKKLIFILICCVFFSNFTFGQDTDPLDNSERFGKNFRVFLGLNAVNNSGDHSPYKYINHWAIGIPISFGIESSIKRDLVFEQSFSINKFKETILSTGSIVPHGYTYFSTSSNLKYFIDVFSLSRFESFQIFANAGLGLSKVKDMSASINIGGGLQYWINGKTAIRFKTIAKFVINHADKSIYDNNHFQHNLELVYRL